MEKLITPSIKALLGEIKHFDFHITGSFALCALGKLNRPIKDLDLVSNDPRLIKHLRKRCMILDDIIDFPNQCRYEYNESLYIDVFINTPIPKEKITPVKILDFNLTLVNPDSIFLNKLSVLQKEGTSLKMRNKIIADLEQYFHLTYN